MPEITPDILELNWPGILVCTLAAGGLGAAWYSPLLFGRAWMAEIGRSESDPAPPASAIGGSVFSCFIAAISMAFLLTALGVDSLVGGLAIGALVGFGIVSMAMLSEALFSGWSARLYAIQVGYRAVYLIGMGGILGAWP